MKLGLKICLFAYYLIRLHLHERPTTIEELISLGCAILLELFEQKLSTCVWESIVIQLQMEK